MTTPNTQATVPAEKHDVTWNEITFSLTRQSTVGREGKSSIAYWGLTDTAYIVTKTVKDDKGVDVTTVDDTATLARITKLHGGINRLLSDIILPKVNANLKATQLKAGKDEYTMEEKATYAKDYIAADWGLNSRGGGGLANAFNALKALNTRQAEINARMLAIGNSMVNPSVPAEEKVKLLTEMQALAAEIATLAAKK